MTLENRPIVKQRKEIETTVEYTVSLTVSRSEVEECLLQYLKKKFPEFRRKNLSLKIYINEETVKIHGYSLERNYEPKTTTLQTGE